MVGSALHRLIPDAATTEDVYRVRPDLRTPAEAGIAIHKLKPDVLYLCAARVGGIGRNISEPGQMLYDNLMIQTNVIEAARLAGVKLIVFLGSSCIYPDVPVRRVYNDGDPLPLEPQDLMTGPLEPTNEPYAIAKIAGIKMLEAYYAQYGLEYLAVMPCNLYGPNDNFRQGQSHLMASLIRRFHEAKEQNLDRVLLWGTGAPRREFLHVDDLALAIEVLVERGARGIVNVGCYGYDNTVRNWADLVAMHNDWNGDIEFDGDSTRDGVQSKLMKTESIPGWAPRKGGVGEAVDWYRQNWQTARR
jgi:GDP-L-fucose synthase